MARICIDPGHGGEDRYNRGPTGYIEPDGVLAISLYMKDELVKAGHEVLLTRYGDKTLTLRQRGQIAADFKADLFISEHTNAGPPTAGGCDVFYSVDIPSDKDLAAKLSLAVSSLLGIRNRGAKVRPSTTNPGEDYYGVIDAAQDLGVPHVFIIESAFHSNTQEEALLKQDEILKKIAQTQARVINEFFGIKEQVKGVDTMVLRKGDRGEAVKQLQLDLNKLGFSCGSADGIFGTNTENAVKAFQSKYNLTVDGIAGPQTLGKIKEVLTPAPAPTIDYKALSEQLQAKLNELNTAYKMACDSRDMLQSKINKAQEVLK